MRYLPHWPKVAKYSLAALVALAVLGLLLIWSPGHLRRLGAPAPLEVRIALQLHPGSALVFTALARGYFADERLSVSVTEYPSGARALAEGLLSGKAEMASCVELPATVELLDGADMRILAGTFESANVNRIVARRSAGIAHPADLRGKRVGTQRASAVHFFLYLFATEHGLSEADFQPLFLKAEDLPAALAEGRIDAFSMREPYVSQAREMLGDDVVVFAEPGLYPQTELFVARGEWIQQHPEAAAAAIRALLRAEAYAVEHPQEVIALTAERVGAPREVVAQSLRPRSDLRVFLDQSLVLLMQSEARWAIAHGLTRAADVPDFREFIHDAPLREQRPEVVRLIE